MHIKQCSKSITIQNIDLEEQKKIIEILKKSFSFNYSEPSYPKWDEWSPKISILSKAKDIDNQKSYTQSGCYKIWLDDEVIYIGETRCTKTDKNGRAGMWARRSDFKSTILGENIQNPYGNGTRYLEKFGKDISKVYHSFHYVHPMFCKQAEQELIKEYYKTYGRLPILQHEQDLKKDML